MTGSEIATLLGAKGAESVGELTRVAADANAGHDAVVFAEDAKSFEAALASAAGLILTSQRLAAGHNDVRLMTVPQPKHAFARCAKALSPRLAETIIHPSAVVHSTANLGSRVHIGALAVIEADVVLGDDTTIGSGVVICQGSCIGRRVVLQAGAVIGSTGFGFVRDANSGEYLLFPQQGSMVIEDDVEIGANTTIDRGALGETRIGRGTKIDNQVHIGHNCRIGSNVVIAAQVGISGSCVVGDGVIMAGQVGLADHVTLGPGVILGGASGVFSGKRLEGPGQMFMGVPAEPLKDYLKSTAKLRRLK